MSETDGQDPPEALASVSQIQELRNSLAQFVSEHLQFLVPGLTDDQLVDLSLKAADEQIQIDREIIPTLSGELALTHPTIVMAAFRNSDPSISVNFKAPKVLDANTEIGLVIAHSMLFALLSAPQLRAHMRALGFTYTFAQTQEALQTASRVIIQ